jgi:hypothetical protein
MDAAGIQYVYDIPVRQVKICIHIEMLYITSGDIFYLRLILLNRKAHSDQDVLTYNPVRGGGEPLVCTSYQQSAIAHGYVDSLDDVCATFVDMCSNGMGAQYRSYFVVLSLNGYATHAIFDDHNKRRFMFMDYITYQGVTQDVAEQMMLRIWSIFSERAVHPWRNLASQHLIMYQQNWKKQYLSGCNQMS